VNARSMADFSEMAATASSQLSAASRLEAFDVSVAMAHRTLLHTTSAHFMAGQVTAILGPNGAGKSTLVSVLTGQRKPGEGRVEMGGQALHDRLPGELARVRAFVAQETQVAFDFTVREVVDLGRYPHRKQASTQEAAIALSAMQATKVDHLADRALNTLSGGEKARVHLARALAQVWESVGDNSSRWLLLDEPTAALDLQHQHRVLQLMQDWASTQGIGVVAVLHDLNLALRYSDRCVVLQQGKMVASGVTAEVLSPECIARVWGVAAYPVRTPGSPGLLQYVFDVS